jgi:hypothetical protein
MNTETNVELRPMEHPASIQAAAAAVQTTVDLERRANAIPIIPVTANPAPDASMPAWTRIDDAVGSRQPIVQGKTPAKDESTKSGPAHGKPIPIAERKTEHAKDTHKVRRSA